VHVGSEVVRLKERCQLLFESQDKAQRSKESIWLTKVQTSNVSVSGNVSGKALHKYSSNRGVVDPAALASDLKHSSSGLWTIRGPNGSGKSSLLKYLNSQIEGSFFLPSHLEGFALPAVDLSQKSSGQRVLEAFRFLVSNLDKHTVIFLDEWDAHLDDEARKECEQLVSQMSNLSVVVQVVHSPDL
jgi:ABC-type phosphate transport system ATPase subunit